MMWIVSANSNQCRIYHYQRVAHKLVLIKEMCEPQNRKRNQDLVSSQAGYTHSRFGRSGTYDLHQTPKETVAINFSKSIAKLLNTAEYDHLYERLVLIADPHMCGLLKQHLEKRVQNRITNTICKDLHDLADSELMEYIDYRI